MESLFTTVFEKNLWLSTESRSGSGSTLDQTKPFIPKLESLFHQLDIKIILDLPCGDFNWMQLVKLPDHCQYIGADVVKTLVDINNEKYANATRSFHHLNICDDKLPLADLIFCRDCLVHLSCVDIKRALVNIKQSGIQYLLATTFTHHGPNRESVLVNMELGLCGWQPLNLQIEPFNFPPPLVMINEGCQVEQGAYADKSLGLWKLSDLVL